HRDIDIRTEHCSSVADLTYAGFEISRHVSEGNQRQVEKPDSQATAALDSFPSQESLATFSQQSLFRSTLTHNRRRGHEVRSNIIRCEGSTYSGDRQPRDNLTRD